jgi:hypothetical protein
MGGLVVVIAHSTLTGLRMLSGALVWAVHFLAIYGFTALACARGFAAAQWLGVGVLAWAIGAATVVALAAATAIIASTRRTPVIGFTEWFTAGVAALAMLAIAWETLSAAMVPACV